MKQQQTFPVLHAAVLQNIQNFEPTLLERKKADVTKDVVDLKVEFDSQLATKRQSNPAPSPEELSTFDLAFRIKLGYMILTEVNQSHTSYRTLIG